MQKISEQIRMIGKTTPRNDPQEEFDGVVPKSFSARDSLSKTAARIEKRQQNLIVVRPTEKLSKFRYANLAYRIRWFLSQIVHHSDSN